MEGKMNRIFYTTVFIFSTSCNQHVDCTRDTAANITFKLAKWHLPNSSFRKHQYKFSESKSEFKFDYFIAGDLGGGFSAVVDRTSCKVVDYYKTQ